MRLKAKVGIVTAIGALAVTGPAVAQACNGGQQGQQGQSKDQHAGQTRGNRGDHTQFVGFGRHGRSFGRSVFGTFVTWTATQTGTNTYSGTITVTKPDFKSHWAGKGSSTEPTQSTQPTQVTYTFTNAKVFFGTGANPPAAGDLVKIIGARLNHCHSSGTTTSTTSGTTTSTGNVRAIFIAAPSSSSTQS
jgi:hypothetical protein